MTTTRDHQLERQRASVDAEWREITALALQHPRAISALAEDIDRFGRCGPVAMDRTRAELIGQLARVALTEMIIRGLESAASDRPDVRLHRGQDDGAG